MKQQITIRLLNVKNLLRKPQSVKLGLVAYRRHGDTNIGFHWITNIEICLDNQFIYLNPHNNETSIKNTNNNNNNDTQQKR